MKPKNRNKFKSALGFAAACAAVLSLLGASASGAETVVEMELEHSPDLEQWESVPLTGDMLSEEGGKIRLPVEGEAGFRQRINVEMVDPAPEGFVLIPAGSFEMGDHFGDGWDEELPVHTVHVSEFHMSRTPVTKAQWDDVRAWAASNGYTDLPGGGGKGSNHPVHRVNWYDAVKWLNAWSERDGLEPVYRVDGEVYRTEENAPTIDYSANGYRLPTEAEWEKAARGGLRGRRFPWGDTISHSHANYNVNSSGGEDNYYSYDLSATQGYHPDYSDGTMRYTSPVGSFSSNGYGLYDMAGNVWEWCNDWFASDYYSSSPEVDPRGPSSGTNRVYRGGNWSSGALSARVSSRGDNSPGARSNFGVGFRPACSSVP